MLALLFDLLPVAAHGRRRAEPSAKLIGGIGNSGVQPKKNEQWKQKKGAASSNRIQRRPGNPGENKDGVMEKFAAEHIHYGSNSTACGACSMMAACRVLRKRQAMVMGPTPPGTGVMAAAF